VAGDVPPTLQTRLGILGLSINREWPLLPIYLGALVYLGVRPGPPEPRRLVSLWVAAGLLGPFVGSSFGHQFIQAVPPLTLATVLVLVWLGHRLRWEGLVEEPAVFRGLRALLLFVAFLAAVTHLPLLHDGITLNGRGDQQTTERTLARLVDSRSGPADTLMPWTTAPWESCQLINLLAGRRSPTRWAAWLTWAHDPALRARQEAERDLSQSPPRFVVIQTGPPLPYPARPDSAQWGSTLFDAWLNQLVATQYRLVMAVPRYALYERQSPSAPSRSSPPGEEN
jgi:hypothetical protein